jgi:superfamily II DNA/RNA helicase
MAVTRPLSPSFTDFGMPARLVDALTTAGITSPFPIQADTLPDSLAGRDVLGRGRTGSGKTYAFLLPVVTRLSQSATKRRGGAPRALILAPTRELARQIEQSLAPLAQAMSLRSMTIFGGVPANPQVRALRDGVDIVIACPGRLEDLMRSGHVNLGSVEVTVIDEADHMADLGFLPVVRRLLDKTPAGGQRLLFSATLDGGVDVLVKRFLSNPVVHSVDSEQSPVATMDHHVLHVDSAARLPIIADLAAAPGRTVVFTRTKFGAKALTRKLNAAGVPAVELHGNLSQNARLRNLEAFSTGRTPTLVATDIAARGIHVDDVALVIHADPPVEHKAYLHRSGRTARAGASGTVVTMMLDAQVPDVRDLTRKAGIKPTITRVTVGDPLLTSIAPGDRTFAAPTTPSTDDTASGSRSGGQSRGRSRGQGGAGRGRGGSGTPAAGTSRSRTRDTGARRGAGTGSATGSPAGSGRTSRGPRRTSGGSQHSAASFSSGRSGGR